MTILKKIIATLVVIVIQLTPVINKAFIQKIKDIWKEK